jgi:uncharacterized membrane protein (DUF4010 family)
VSTDSFALLAGLSLPDAGAALAAALGCGLLIGIERERRKGEGPQRRAAGVRTFALAAVTGCAAMLAGGVWLAMAGALLVGALTVVAYLRERTDDPGMTSEIALLLTYLVGVLCTASLLLAAALSVGLTALLAARDPMHRFARQWLTPAEVRDGIVLAALALIAVPLLPDRPLLGPVLNPQVMARLLALLLAIQALAHLARRLMQARHALMLSAVSTGFVSSTAGIASYGMEVREGRAGPAAAAGAGLLTCVATMLQLLVVAAAVQPDWLRILALPCLAGAGVAGLWGAWLVRQGVTNAPPAPEAAPDEPMFSLRGAAVVALLLTGIQIGVHGLRLWLGDAGLLGGTLLAALFELHSAMAAVLAQAGPQDAAGPTLLRAVMLGLAVHGVAKSVTATLSGGRAYALRIVPGLLAHTLVCVAGLWLAG